MNPDSLRQCGSVKIQGRADGIVAVQDPYSRFCRSRRRGAIYASVFHGFELSAVYAVENNAGNGVGELRTCDPIQNDVSNSNLTVQWLRSAFGVNDPAQPIEVDGVVIGIGRSYRCAGKIRVPFYMIAQSF